MTKESLEEHLLHRLIHLLLHLERPVVFSLDVLCLLRLLPQPPPLLDPALDEVDQGEAAPAQEEAEMTADVGE